MNTPFTTPLIRQPLLEIMNHAPVYLKCENVQQTHSFKARGAFRAVQQLNEEEVARGVITHSSGNHGQALAWAARMRGMKAHIVVPENAPIIKVEGIKAQGGIVHYCAAGLTAREEKLQEIQAVNNAVFIPPYNHEDIISGQSTCAEEIFAEQPELDFLLVPVGGGGLLSGSAIAAQRSARHTKVYGCEPAEANDAQRSFHSGKLEDPGNPNTIADGLRTGLGEITFSYIQQHVHDILTVSEDEIMEAWAFAIHQMKMVIEPSSAVPVAVLKKYPEHFRAKKGAIIISGGNVNIEKLPPHAYALTYM